MNFVAPWLYAVAASVLSAIALALGFKGLTPGLAHVALAIGAGVGAAGFWEARRATFRWPRFNGWEWGVTILFALFALRAFLWIVFPAFDEIKVLSPNNLGDLSLHLTYIREMANGEPFWPENPIFTGTKLSYPIGIDLFHSLLVLCGGDVFRLFVWLGLAGALLTWVMLQRWGGSFTVMGFLCNGGLAGLAFFFSEPIGRLADYQAPFAWKSIPLALFVTQRGFLFALPAGLLLLCSWRARFFPEDAADARPLPRWGEWLLYASMPVFHFHTFLFLSLLLGWWFLFYEETRAQVLRLVLLALVPATLLVLLITEFMHGPKVLGLALGWMQDEAEYLEWCRRHLLPREFAIEDPAMAPPILGTWAVLITRPVFWLLNFGFLPFFTAVVTAKIWTNRAAVSERAYLTPALVIFALCLVVKFAPWEWDNTKLMIWSYLILLPILWQRLVRPWPFSVRVIGCVALFISGFVCLLGGLNERAADGTNGSAIATRSELDGVAQALQTIPPRERFLARPNYNHPLLLLGRKVVAGYLGHLWSHGYDYQATWDKLATVMNGGEGWRETAQSLGARYLFWGAQEREQYPDSTEPWRDTARVVATGSWGTIYDLVGTSED